MAVSAKQKKLKTDKRDATRIACCLAHHDYIPNEQRGDEFSCLLSERLSFLADTVFSFKVLGRCIREERDFNADSSDAAAPPDDAEVSL